MDTIEAILKENQVYTTQLELELLRHFEKLRYEILKHLDHIENLKDTLKENTDNFCGHAYCNLKKANIGCCEVECKERTD